MTPSLLRSMTLRFIPFKLSRSTSAQPRIAQPRTAYAGVPHCSSTSASVRAAALLALALTVPLAAQAAMPAVPTLHVATLDGKTFDLAAQRGKWVIVNYWATWCVPCIKEMPDISQFVATHKNVAAIGLAFDDSDPADIKAFIAKHPVSYPIAQVTLDKPVKDFDEPRGLPTTWLIRPDGTVAKPFVGPVTAALLAAAIGSK